MGNKSIMSRSDIPYSVRLQIKQAKEAERAERISLYCMALSLHANGVDSQGVSDFLRTCRNRRSEFHEDADVSLWQCSERLAAIGVDASKDWWNAPGVNKKALRASQAALIMGAVIMDDLFELTAEQQEEVARKTQGIAAGPVTETSLRTRLRVIGVDAVYE